MSPRFAPGPIDAVTRARAVESLRTVGGIYDLVAAYVERDLSMPHARVVQQRVMLPHVAAPLKWRAVCDHHEGADWLVPAWQSAETHDAWIAAAIDAREHDALEHGRPA